MMRSHSPRAPLACLAFLACASVGGIATAGATDATDAALAPSRTCQEPIVQEYEPTTLGYTWQSDDEPHVDFTLSLKAPLFQSLLCGVSGGRGHLYLAFTGRFALYVHTRHSGPVIGREYNPKLLWRFVDANDRVSSMGTYNNQPIEEFARYLDIAYAHSSDGQTIDTLQEYEIQSSQSGSARDALDYISRGWDYLEVAAKTTIHDAALRDGDLAIYPDLKFFLRHGLLEGVPEEYHSWERDSTLRPRHAFDGVSVTFEYRPFAERIDPRSGIAPRGLAERTLVSMRFELTYTTGYDPVARYNTVRGEVGIAPFGLPLALWIQDGYMSSLARYYRKTTAGGIELRFIEF